LVEKLDVRRGGVAANICFGMAQLGLRPFLVAAVGADFAEYRSWLESHGVDTESVHVSERRHTARFFCTTDDDNNQIASFYAGAMTDAREIELAPIARRVGGIDLVVVSPNDPEAMQRHTAEARRERIPFMSDPSQQLARLDGPDIVRLIDGARYLVANDYEMALIESKTGWDRDEVLKHSEICVMTLGPEGSVILQKDKEAIPIKAVAEEAQADPTGVGDAFRAGFLAGQAFGLGLERSAQIGSLLATYVLERVGTQEYHVERPAFVSRFASAFGDEAASELRSCL
jgi:adenosine kinase